MDGTDCPAVGAGHPAQIVCMDMNKDGRAATTWTLSRDGNDIVLSNCSSGYGWRIPAVTSYDDMLTGMHVLSDRLHGRVQTAPPAPDLAARLDGLSAKIDALAERLDRKAGDDKVTTPRAVEIMRSVRISGRGLCWIVPHDPEIKVGGIVYVANNDDAILMGVTRPRPRPGYADADHGAHRQAREGKLSMAETSTIGSFILSGCRWKEPYQERFDTLDEVLGTYAAVQYHWRDDDEAIVPPWWPEEIVLPDGTVVDASEIESLRPAD